MAEKKLRIALIGCGDVGLRNIQAINEAELCELIMVIDKNPEMLESIQTQFQCSTATNAAEAIEREDIDAVFVATPHYCHAELSSQALRSGKHVILEKPIARTPEEAKRVCLEAETSGRLLTICHPKRYDELVQISQKMIADGEIGDIRLVVSNYYRAKDNSYWESGLTGRAHSTWRSEKELSGGGVLIMNGVHQIDSVLTIIKQNVKNVISSGTTIDLAADIENCVSLVMNFDGGLLCFIQTCVVPGTSHRVEDRFIGSRGEIIVRPRSVEKHISIQGEKKTVIYERTRSDRSKVLFLNDFALAVREGRDAPVPAQYGLQILEIVAAAYRSHESGRVEKV